MKHTKALKIISVFTAVLLLIAAMAIPAFAAEGDTYQITIESGSEVYTPDPASATVTDGETYTFTLPDNLPTTLHDDELGDYKVEFSCWRFTGDYEVVSGTVNEAGECLEKTVTLKPKSDLKAVACFYEDNALFYMVSVDANNKAYEPYIEQGECAKGENWTFSVPEELEGFSRWEFTGEYEVVEGAVDVNGVSKDRKVVLKPASSIQAFARFEEAQEPVDDKTDGKATDDEATVDEKKGNDSKTSPKTGDMLPVVISMMFIAAAAGAFAIKKIKE